PTAWAAQRVLTEHPDFDPKKTATPLLTGEMCFDWYTELDPALQPMAEATEILAQYTHWGPLYDLDQLAKNSVPVAALVHAYNVMVVHNINVPSPKQINSLQIYESVAWHHDGIGEAGADIFLRIIDMIKRSSHT